MVGSAEVNEGCFVDEMKSHYKWQYFFECPGYVAKAILHGPPDAPCAGACQLTQHVLETLKANAEMCEKAGRGDDVAEGIRQLSAVAASETCSGGAASLVATKGATSSWFALPDPAALTQGSMEKALAVGASAGWHRRGWSVG